MTVGLRRAQADELPALVELWVAAWTAAMPTIDFAARRSWFANHLAGLTQAGAELVVAHDPSGAIGFVTIDPSTQVLDQLAVAVDQQGRGTATLLLDAAKRLSPMGLRLSVNTDNLGALSLYRRNGFSACGEGINPRSGLAVLHLRWTP